MYCSEKAAYLIVVNAKLVEEYFPHFTFQCSESGNPYFQGEVTPSLTSYRLRLELPPGSPDVVPCLYVVAPSPLYKNDFSKLGVEGLSHTWHTRGAGPGGSLEICHIDPNEWDATNTYVQVLMKGVLWLKAYENHLQTGDTIASYFENILPELMAGKSSPSSQYTNSICKPQAMLQPERSIEGRPLEEALDWGANRRRVYNGLPEIGTYETELQMPQINQADVSLENIFGQPPITHWGEYSPFRLPMDLNSAEAADDAGPYPFVSFDYAQI